MSKILFDSPEKIRTELVSLNTKTLLSIAKEYNIKGRHDLRKTDLIEALVSAAISAIAKEESIEPTISVDQRDKDTTVETEHKVVLEFGHYDCCQDCGMIVLHDASSTCKECDGQLFSYGDFVPHEEAKEEIKEEELQDDHDTSQGNHDSAKEGSQVKESDDSEERSEEERAQQKYVYLLNANEGAIVAFRNRMTGRVKSAKILLNDRSGVMRLETGYGKTYTITYEDIIWVKSGNRWPNGVYNLLKGITNETQKSNI